ncbi:hypothetical protein CUMW_031140 [Citrus unshiu]|nr:hypothetical protein CUMW_031140 [Citrus unshiu]
MSGLEILGANDEIRERRSDFENSEDERRRSRIGSLKKKAINASNKFTHSLKRRGKRKIDYRVPSVPIEDVRDEREESAVLELRQKLLERDLLPPRQDDYHTLLRFLKAREFNIERTIQMWEEMLIWRKEILSLRSWRKSCNITLKDTMELIRKDGQFTLSCLGKLIQVG